MPDVSDPADSNDENVYMATGKLVTRKNKKKPFEMRVPPSPHPQNKVPKLCSPMMTLA